MPKIFVGNLPFDTCETDLRTQFEVFGHVASVTVATDASNRSRGFAFVVMPSLDDADEAVHRMSGTVLGGRCLTVNTSEDTPRRPQSGDANQARSEAMSFFDALMSD